MSSQSDAVSDHIERIGFTILKTCSIELQPLLMGTGELST